VKVVITGGAGFLGRLLRSRIDERGFLAGPGGHPAAVDEVVLFDHVPGPEVVEGDIADPAALAQLIAGDEVSVFHLASVVSGAAERDFDRAIDVNVTGLLCLIGACRALPVPPRLVFTSSIAVFGGGVATVGDNTKHTPQTTYGITKAVGELVVNDATRRRFVDGRSARLPHVIVRPGPPNAAASGFASAVFREPLAGTDYHLPVRPDTVMPVLGVRAVIDGIIAIHDLDGDRLGADRAVGLPALPVTVADMLATLERVGAGRRLGRVVPDPDPFVQRIVDGWPQAVDATRGLSFGLPISASLDAIVEEYLEDLG
jgi:nucleoside-diphosphate-sugar epimerase